MKQILSLATVSSNMLEGEVRPLTLSCFAANLIGLFILNNCCNIFDTIAARNGLL